MHRPHFSPKTLLWLMAFVVCFFAGMASVWRRMERMSAQVELQKLQIESYEKAFRIIEQANPGPPGIFSGPTH